VSSSARQVVCTKWGAKFPADEVNRLYRMVRHAVSGPLKFVCATDRADGIIPEVEVVPLPAVPVVGDRDNRGWKKLGLFASSEQLGGLSGPTLYLDLDVVIVDSLDPFFELDGAFRVIKDYKPFRYRHGFTGNTSTFRFNAGAHTDLLDELRDMGEAVLTRYRNEQEFISDYMRRRGLLDYWPRPWCASFKHDCVKPLPLGAFQAPRKPYGAKLIVFHGTPKPEEALIGGIGNKWYRVIRAAPWLKPYMDVGSGQNG